MWRWRSKSVETVGIQIDYLSFLLLVFCIPYLIFVYLYTMSGNVLIQFMMLFPAFAYALVSEIKPVLDFRSLSLVVPAFAFIVLSDVVLVRSITSGGVPMDVVLIAPVAGVVEESFFRGMLLNIQITGVPKYGIPIMFVLNSLIFTMFHWWNMLNIFKRIYVPYLVAMWTSGMVCCIVAYASRMVLPAILVHMLVNLSAIIASREVV